MTSRRRRAHGQTAPPGAAGAGALVAAPASAQQRLQHLYEISKLFASFENIEQTFEPALGIVAKALPLRSAVLIERETDGAKMVVWRSEGQSAEQQRVVKAHVEVAYRYLVGAGANCGKRPAWKELAELTWREYYTYYRAGAGLSSPQLPDFTQHGGFTELLRSFFQLCRGRNKAKKA